MKTKTVKYQIYTSFYLFAFLITFVSCNTKNVKKSLIFKDYPNLKIGFSTQNFQNAMPITVGSLTEIIEYASKEGYNFIELRDDLAKLTTDECKFLAEVAQKNKVDVIYEIHKNLLDSGYFDIFDRGLTNTLLFPGPGILRTVISKSEFDSDVNKKGWNKDELLQLAKIADSCALICLANNVKFIVENLNEAFFGEGLTYFGLTDFFVNTTGTGLQLDIGNPFRNSSREKANPEKVIDYLSALGNRWVTSHLKTVRIQGGESQPILTDNPLQIEKVIEMMAQQNVLYAAIELTPVTDKQQCFNNHAKSIQFLKDKGVLN